VVLANAGWHQRCIKNAMYFRNQPIVIPSDSLSSGTDSVTTLPADTTKAP
jgi:hypothetical protein